MYSATLTPQTEGLAKMSLKNPVYVAVDEQKMSATVDGLEQVRILCCGSLLLLQKLLNCLLLTPSLPYAMQHTHTSLQQ